MSETSTVRPLLQMLDAVLADDESAPAGTLVMPCLTDDLVGDINVLSAAVHRAGGALLNTSRVRADFEVPAEQDNYRGPVMGRSTSAMASMLAASVSYPRAGGVLGVRISDLGGNRLDAEYSTLGEPSAVPPPTSDDALLAIVRALCSTRFESQQGKLAVLVYSEGELDPEQRIAAWQLSAHLRSQSVGPRTLVILAAGEVDVRRHVSFDTGFRYAHGGAQLIRRRPPEACRAMVADVVRSSAPFVGVFLGAGFSASSGLLLGNALRDDALRALGLSQPGADSDQLAADWYRHIAGIGGLLDSEVPLSLGQRVEGLTLERVLREEYRTFSPEPPPTLVQFQQKCNNAISTIGPAPLALADIVASGRKLVLCTVNFDELIEASAPGSIEAFTTDDEFENAPKHLQDYLAGTASKVPLWKLHGTISNLQSCVASDDQTLLGLSPAKRRALDVMVGVVSSPVPWLYVGASMRDSDLNPLWGRSEFAEKVREYWVMPFGAPTVTNFVDTYRAEMWRQRDRGSFEQRLVTETADTFFIEFARQVKADRTPT